MADKVEYVVVSRKHDDSWKLSVRFDNYAEASADAEKKYAKKYHYVQFRREEEIGGKFNEEIYWTS